MQATDDSTTVFNHRIATDRAPQAPMLGFVLGTALAALLWGLIGSFAWVVLG